MATLGGRIGRAVTAVRTPKQRAAAEDAGLRHLTERGLALLVCNARYPEGELDLIMRERDVLVFVEVRTRSASAFGGAAPASTASSRSGGSAPPSTGCCSITATAGRHVRFDVVTVQGDGTIE